MSRKKDVAAPTMPNLPVVAATSGAIGHVGLQLSEVPNKPVAYQMPLPPRFMS